MKICKLDRKSFIILAPGRQEEEKAGTLKMASTLKNALKIGKRCPLPGSNVIKLFLFSIYEFWK
jgi:hypothetical protein